MMQTVWSWLNRFLGTGKLDQGDRLNRSLPPATDGSALQPCDDDVRLTRGKAQDADAAQGTDAVQGIEQSSYALPMSTQPRHMPDLEPNHLSPPPSATPQPITNAPVLSADAGQCHDLSPELSRDQLDTNHILVTTEANLKTDAKRLYDEQAQLIQALQQQLFHLGPTATIGEAWVNRWQSQTGSVGDNDLKSLPRNPEQSHTIPDTLDEQLRQQSVEIEHLKQTIQDAQRLSTIGEARLNRWKARTYSE